jgi:TolB-like protein/tetratricopeptide (TPR) repeat protein
MLGGSPAESYIGVGIADAITTRLANTRQLALRPTSAVLPFQNAQSEPTRVASSLKVQHLLLGTIQTTGEGYRVSLQLVRADGVAVWGRSFDEPRSGLLQLQDHIADQVVGALQVELSPLERKRLHPRHTSNPAAHDRYLRGRSLLVNYTETNMRDAVAFFEQALALDADYALARASLATACAWFSVRYAYEHEALAWGARAEQEARRALKQDDELADAHFALASAAGTLHGGFAWQDVLAHSTEALVLDPSLELAHLARMRAFYHLGLFEQAMEEARLARSVNPTPSIELSRLEVASRLFAGDFAESARLAGELLPRTDAPAVPHYLALAKYYLGEADLARQMLASISRGGTPDARAQASLASIEAAVGLHDEARRRVATVVSGPYMDHHVAYSLGAAYAQLGDASKSVEWLQQAADTGFPSPPWYARDPLLQPVRKDARFAVLMARLREAQSSHR